MTAKAPAITPSFTHVARARLPIVQKTRPWSVSSVAINCIIETNALKVNTMAIPNSTTPDVGTRVQRVIPSNNKADNKANRNAFADIHHWSGIPGIPIPKTIANAAPNEAAFDKPRVNGLANGLFRIVCISAPANPSDIPTTTAIKA